MYKSFFKITSKPFENTPDPGFLYLSAQHQEVLSSLIYGIEEAKGFILIAGDVGTGKTTLLNALLQKIEKHIVVHVNNPHTSFNEVFDFLMAKLDLPRSGNLRLQESERLKEKLEEMHNQGTRVVLIIDEAHLLSEESLQDIRLLSNIENEKSKLIQIILSGQNEVHNLLNRDSQKPLKQRIVINRQLLPLSRAETTAYINHRLKIAGRFHQLFTPDAIALIWKQSNGLPRLINQMCDNALLIGYALNAKLIDKKIIKEVVGDMPRSVSLFAALLFFMKNNRKNLAIAVTVIICSGLLSWQAQTTNNPIASQPMTNPLSAKPINTTPIEQLHAVTEKQEQAPNDHAPLIFDHAEPDNKESSVNLVSYSNRFARDGRVVKVEKTTSLTALANQVYDSSSETVLDYIQRANKGIDDINRIYTGQNIFLPLITRADLIIRGSDDMYHVHYASFYTGKIAENVNKRLQKEGKNAFLKKERQGSNTIYRVYVGSVLAQKDAITILESLDYKYLPFLIENKRA